MSRKCVKYELELDHLPPLTKQQKAELAALEAASDGESDYSCAPRTIELSST